VLHCHHPYRYRAPPAGGNWFALGVHTLFVSDVVALLHRVTRFSAAAPSDRGACEQPDAGARPSLSTECGTRYGPDRGSDERRTNDAFGGSIVQVSAGRLHRGVLARMTSFNSRYRQLFHVFATPHEVWPFLPTEG
jgi:hypothetical protein